MGAEDGKRKISTHIYLMTSENSVVGERDAQNAQSPFLNLQQTRESGMDENDIILLMSSGFTN